MKTYDLKDAKTIINKTRGKLYMAVVCGQDHIWVNVEKQDLARQIENLIEMNCGYEIRFHDEGLVEIDVF